MDRTINLTPVQTARTAQFLFTTGTTLLTLYWGKPYRVFWGIGLIIFIFGTIWLHRKVFKGQDSTVIDAIGSGFIFSFLICVLFRIGATVPLFDLRILGLISFAFGILITFFASLITIPFVELSQYVADQFAAQPDQHQEEPGPEEMLKVFDQMIRYFDEQERIGKILANDYLARRVVQIDIQSAAFCFFMAGSLFVSTAVKFPLREQMLMCLIALLGGLGSRYTMIQLLEKINSNSKFARNRWHDSKRVSFEVPRGSYTRTSALTVNKKGLPFGSP